MCSDFLAENSRADESIYGKSVVIVCASTYGEYFGKKTVAVV